MSITEYLKYNKKFKQTKKEKVILFPSTRRELDNIQIKKFFNYSIIYRINK